MKTIFNTPNTIDNRALCTKLLLIYLFLICSCQKSKNEVPIIFDDLTELKAPFLFSISPDGRKLAYASSDSLFTKIIDEKSETFLISDGMSSEISNANPFLAWSTDSESFIFRRDNEEIVIVDYRGEKEDVIVSADKGVKLQTLENFYIEGAVWSPNNRYITFPAKDNLTQSRSQLWSYDVVKKELVCLTSENNMIVSHDWVDENSLVYSIGAFIGQKGAIKLLELSSGDKTTLIEGKESVYNQLAYNSKSGLLFASSASYSPYLFKKESADIFTIQEHNLPPAYYSCWTLDGQHLLGRKKAGMNIRPFIIHVDSTSQQMLFAKEGIIGNQQIAKVGDKEYLFYSLESGNLPKSFFKAEISRSRQGITNDSYIYNGESAFEGKSLPKVEIISWLQDGETLTAQLFIPKFLKEKAPLVLIPYANTYTNRFPKLDYFLDQGVLLLLEKGYAVAFANNTGGTNRQRLDKDYGSRELRDALGFMQAVGNHANIDTSRVSLIGHSHGATMVSYFISHSTRFNKAVAINGAYDWILQANDFPGRMYGFPYGMGGTPIELPEKYDTYSPLENIDAIKTPILLITGKNDQQIPPIHGEKFYNALVMAGAQAEFMPFEDEGHLISKVENQRKLWAGILQFFD